MNWQVKYALENFRKDGGSTSAAHVCGDVIRVSTTDRPEVLAIISSAETIDIDTARKLHKDEPNMDFLCGYRKNCVWEGEAIAYLEERGIGWGSFGTLCFAASAGNAKASGHKMFEFADRLYRQTHLVADVEREYDRVHKITLKSDGILRIGMVAEYEPTADAVRSFWKRFGPVDIIWNINPYGNPTRSALKVGNDLGCKVFKWDGLKAHMKKA